MKKGGRVSSEEGKVPVGSREGKNAKRANE